MDTYVNLGVLVRGHAGLVINELSLKLCKQGLAMVHGVDKEGRPTMWLYISTHDTAQHAQANLISPNCMAQCMGGGVEAATCIERSI